ncbi:MAG: universal stress protein [Bacteroidia bacterium]
MKKILVPTDFSECANYAVRFAGTLARKLNAKIYLLHVIDVLGIEESTEEGRWATEQREGGSGMVPFKIALMKKTKTQMEETISTYLEGVEVEDEIEMGNASRHILIAMEKYKPDLVVMGTHGTSGFDEELIGTHAERVARKSAVPLLAIKHPVEREIRKLLFASNFDEKETPEVFHKVEKLAKDLGADIHLVKVVTPSLFSGTKETRSQIRKFLDKAGASEYPFSLFNDTSTEKGIVHFADEIDADMVVLGTHGRSGFSQLFKSSVAEGLINHSFIPVLSVPIGSRD